MVLKFYFIIIINDYKLKTFKKSKFMELYSVERQNKLLCNIKQNFEVELRTESTINAQNSASDPDWSNGITNL